MVHLGHIRSKLVQKWLQKRVLYFCDFLLCVLAKDCLDLKHCISYLQINQTSRVGNTVHKCPCPDVVITYLAGLGRLLDDRWESCICVCIIVAKELVMCYGSESFLLALA